MPRISVRIREQVRQRANGRSHQVDHIIPEKHTGTSELDNLAWACFRCNNTKRSEIASYDTITRQLTPLFNPRTQTWTDHFEMNEDTVIIAKTPIARVTVHILQMNRPRQVEIRRTLLFLDLW